MAAALAGLLLYHGVGLVDAGSRIATGVGGGGQQVRGRPAGRPLQDSQAVRDPGHDVSCCQGLRPVPRDVRHDGADRGAGPGIDQLVDAIASGGLLAAGVVLAKYLMRPFIEQMQHLSQRRNRRR
ncbi:hypothetical protein QJS66_09180 [Kocuria rhizophila]|nr:hypothetical protein QJS66_09180 [Kocuria rhizophila]